LNLATTEWEHGFEISLVVPVHITVLLRGRSKMSFLGDWCCYCSRRSRGSKQHLQYMGDLGKTHLIEIAEGMNIHLQQSLKQDE